MIFFSKKNHPLPKFPSTVADTFRDLCELLTDEEVAELLPQVDECLSQLEREAQTNQTIDIKAARQLAELSKYLLSQYSTFSDEEKPLILGAVRYFAVSEDSLSEQVFVTGFTDDIKVMNHVLEEIGREDLVMAL